MAANDFFRQCKDGILNNKLVTILSIALFAFIISTIALASSNQSKKEAIQECQAELIDTSPRCSVAPAKDLPKNEPVYLKHDGTSFKLWAPEGPALIWNTSSEKTGLLCSGTGNSLEQTNTVLTENTCIRGTQFTVGKETVSSKDLKCKLPVDGDVVENVGSCGNDRGILNKIGFNAISVGFIAYIDACFNTARSSVLYTRHILPGAAIADAVAADDFQNWRRNGIGDKAKPDDSYTQAAQVRRLTDLLGSKEQAEKFVAVGKVYLNKGHLTPRGDGVFQTWKHATFFYTNAVPQWNLINEGNWNSVEIRARSIAALLQEDLVVIQGTFGVLSLPNTENVQISISLEQQGIDVPLWMWKIIKSPRHKAGIAFVTLNNPHATTLTESEHLCPDICEKYGWAEKEFGNFSRGLTYCCDPCELIRRVSHAPDEGCEAKILTTAMLTSNAISLHGFVQLLLLVCMVHVLRFS